MSADQVLKQQIIEKAWEDPSFKQKLLSDPKTAIQDAFGVTIPDEIQLKALEETQTDFYLVIPPNPAETNNGSDSDSNAAW
ncbi:MAG: leader peptide family natural product precursor [Paenibacillus sp.]|jgi:peroxiredoxin|nr:leader peptide family natural product precursor [Paenibacillus sp.]